MNKPSNSTTAPVAPDEQKAKTRTERAVDTGYLVCSLIHVCRAAAEFASDNEGYPCVQHVTANVYRVLEHVEVLAGNMLDALEHAVLDEGARP